jgi:hypothetical protein
MKQLTILMLTVSLSTTIFGQKYLTADIKSKADSILRIYIGEFVFNNYCSYDINTYYEYKGIFGKTHWETLNKFKKTKGKFVKVDMRWNLAIPYPVCPAFDTIRGKTSFIVDNLLRPTGKPYLEFIPDFYWTKDSCHLICEDEALTIAKQQNLKTAVDKPKVKLYYITKSKYFFWEVSQTLWTKKDSYNNDYGEIEVVSIDAKTGEIISHETIPFSTDH